MDEPRWLAGDVPRCLQGDALGDMVVLESLSARDEVFM